MAPDRETERLEQEINKDIMECRGGEMLLMMMENML